MDTLQNKDANIKSNSITKTKKKSSAFSIVTPVTSTEIDLYGGAENEKLLAPVPLGLHDENIVLWSRVTESIVRVPITNIKSPQLLSVYCGADWLSRLYRKIDPRTGLMDIDYQRASLDIAKKAGTLKYFSQSDCYATGCWRGDDGGLVINSGNFCVDQKGNNVERIDLTRKRNTIYTTRSNFSMPEFVSEDVEKDSRIVNAILSDLASWQYVYENSTVGGVMVAGWLVSAVYCAALETRPSLWVTGIAGTGKTKLFQYISGLLGKSALSSENATAAGVRQSIDDSSVPAILDEFETSGTKMSVSQTKAVMKTLREAFSAKSVTLKGTSGQTGKQYRQQYPFALFSVSSPALEGPDAGRIIRLRLKSAKYKNPVPLAKKYTEEDRARFIWVIWRNWDLYQSILEAVRVEYLAQDPEADAREIDAYGTVIAGTILLLNKATAKDFHEYMPTVVSNILSGLKEEIESAREQRKEHESVYNEIMDTKIRVEYTQHNDSSGIENTRIETMTIGMALHKAEDDDEFADNALRMIGIKAKFKKDGVSYTAIAVKNGELARLMSATRWSSDGSWAEPLKATPGCLQKSHPVRFTYTAAKAILIPSSCR